MASCLSGISEDEIGIGGLICGLAMMETSKAVDRGLSGSSRERPPMLKKFTRALTVPLVAAAVLGGGGAALASTASTGAAQAQAQAQGQGQAQAAKSSPAVKPTIVLVHGAFADSTSWSSEIAFLQKQGY